MKPINFSLAPHWKFFDSELSESWCKRKIKFINDPYHPRKFSVHTSESHESEKVFMHLKDFLGSQGFAPRKATNLYCSYEFAVITGSVPTHIDSSHGLAAGVLLFAAKAKKEDSRIELVTSYGGLLLSTNDVFVFNANKWHGWISDVTCLLAMMTIKKIPSKKATQSKMPQS